MNASSANGLLQIGVAEVKKSMCKVRHSLL
jgi:hypothetical protein